MPLQTGIIYGPVRSRRLGLSLGVNLLPSRYKLCSFNCVYCQYGWTPKPTIALTYQLKDLPHPNEVVAALEKALQRLSQEGSAINSISICGNGEPTLYPNLHEVVEAAKRLRDQYFPEVQVAIFSNSSTVGSQQVRDTLDLLDARIMKFDAGSEELITKLNHPANPIYVGEIVAGLKKLKDVSLASLFVQGRVTNADPDSIAFWLEKVGEIKPIRVQVYTLDRAPADRRIEGVSRNTLEWIANQVRFQAGAPADVF